MNESSAIVKLKNLYNTCFDYHEPKDDDNVDAGINDLKNYVDKLIWVIL